MILDGDFHALAFRIPRVDGNLARFAINVYLDAFQILAIRVRGLHCFHFNFVAIPTLHLHGTVHILEEKAAARREGIALLKSLAVGNRGEARWRENRDATKQQQHSAACSLEKPQSMDPEPSFPHFFVHGTPPRLLFRQLPENEYRAL